VRIHAGQQDGLKLGNLEARRDWGYSKEYCEWIWRIMQYPDPTDFLIATGENHTVEEFVAEAFACLDMDWRRYVTQDPDLMRPAEVDELLGDPSKSRRLLGFEPKVRFKELVRLMVNYELTAFTDPRGCPADADRMDCGLTVPVG
jgi:GDPmannose 4,6-dehydratase